MNYLNLVTNNWFTAFGLNFLLILCSYRFQILTKKGWIHAGMLGTILFGCLSWQGWTAVVIYLALGSLVTKIGFKRKELKGIAESRGGRRGPENVWGSAGTGAIIAILIKLGIGSSDLLTIAFSSSFAAKLGDTFGSEIGKTWGTRTFLITTFKPVLAGTEGAVSREGTLASLMGSTFMAVTLYFLGLVPNSQYILVVIISGFIATIFESFIGAIFQNRITYLTNEVVNFIQTSFAAIFSIIFSLLIT